VNVLPSSRASERTVTVGRLALAETLPFLRDPFVLAGTAASLALAAWLFRGQIPTFTKVSLLTAGWLMPLCAVTFLVTGVRVLRPERWRTTELLDALPTTARLRVLGHLVSVLAPAWWGGVAAMLVLLGARVRGAAGEIVWAEIALGPLVVVLYGTIAFAIASATRSLRALPLALAVLAISQYWLSLDGWTSGNPRGGTLGWLAFWVPPPSSVPSPIFLDRPSLVHLAYVAAMAVACVALALMQKRIDSASALALGLAVVLAVLAGGGQKGSALPARAELHEQVELLRDSVIGEDCSPIGRARYCPYPGFDRWISLWRPSIEGVLQAVPSRHHMNIIVSQVPSPVSLAPPWVRALPEDLIVRHDTGFVVWENANRVLPGMEWITSPARNSTEMAMAIDAASIAAGVSIRPRLNADGDFARCSLIGQSRGIITAWLAAQATPRTRDGLLELAADEPWRISGDDGGPDMSSFSLRSDLSGLSTASPARWGRAEVVLAEQLLARPNAEVRSLVARNWETLLDPATTTEVGGQILGLQKLPTITELGVQAGLDRASAAAMEERENLFVADIPSCPDSR